LFLSVILRFVIVMFNIVIVSVMLTDTVIEMVMFVGSVVVMLGLLLLLM